MTDVSVVLRPPSEGHQHGVSIQSSINLGETRTDLNLGEVIGLSIIYHIPDS